MPVSGPRSSALRRSRGHEEGVAGTESEGGLSLDPHLDRARQDVAHLFSRMHVPARLDAGRDLGEDLDNLPSRDGGCFVLELGALERLSELVDRLLRVRGGFGRHSGTSWFSVLTA